MQRLLNCKSWVIVRVGNCKSYKNYVTVRVAKLQELGNCKGCAIVRASAGSRRASTGSSGGSIGAALGCNP